MEESLNEIDPNGELSFRFNMYNSATGMHTRWDIATLMREGRLFVERQIESLKKAEAAKKAKKIKEHLAKEEAAS